MKKYIIIFAITGVTALLIWSHSWMYFAGKRVERARIQQENINLIDKQQKAMANANTKILDFQRIISYNTDECFNRVWPDEIVRAANPILR